MLSVEQKKKLDLLSVMTFDWNSGVGYLMIMFIVCISIFIVIATGWVIYERCISTDSNPWIDIESGSREDNLTTTGVYYGMTNHPETSAL